MNRVIVIVGPTASGKSAVALSLALKLGGEIVNADSRQIYRFLDAGTSKPSPEDFKKTPHHLYDFLDPKETYSAGLYARDAKKAIEKIGSAKKISIVVGGTGLYLRALFDGMTELPQRDEETRKKLMNLAEEKGRKFLHQKLLEADPVSAAGIPYQNIQRVVRALEVYHLTGKPMSQWHRESKQKENSLNPIFFGLERPKEILHQRITERSQKILPGLIQETKMLLERGTKAEDPGLQSLGYRTVVQFLEKKISREELLTSLVRETRAYAKRQVTWFKRDARIQWIQIEEPFDPEATAQEVIRRL